MVNPWWIFHSVWCVFVCVWVYRDVLNRRVTSRVIELWKSVAVTRHCAFWQVNRCAAVFNIKTGLPRPPSPIIIRFVAAWLHFVSKTNIKNKSVVVRVGSGSWKGKGCDNWIEQKKALLMASTFFLNVVFN